MSSANVITPTAPPETQIYPDLPPQPGDFRMQKINEIATTLNQEVDHYRLVAKKYKKARTVLKWTSAGAGILSTVLSSASLGSALSGIGIFASIPLGAAAGCFGLSSAGLIVVSKKIESKLSKHQEIMTLAVAKLDTVNRLLSKALTDNKVTDVEFQLILDEKSQYFAFKEDLRSKQTRKSSQNPTVTQPDLDKIRQQIRYEERKKLEKKIQRQSIESALNLN